MNLKKIILEEVKPKPFGKVVATIMIGNKFVNLYHPPNLLSIDEVENTGTNVFGRYKTTVRDVVSGVLEDWRDSYNNECFHCPWAGMWDSLGFDPNEAEVVEYYEGYIPHGDEIESIAGLFESEIKEELLCAILFNTQGMLDELVKERSMDENQWIKARD